MSSDLDNSGTSCEAAESVSPRPSVKLDPGFSSGDFSFLASDGTIFLIDSDCFPGDSPKLSQAIETACSLATAPRAIHFDEPSLILRSFLHALVHRRVPTPASLSLDNFRLLLSFTSSMCASSTLALLVPQLKLYASHPRADKYYLFLAAAEHSQWDVCGLAMSAWSKDRVWLAAKGKRAEREREIDRALGCVVGCGFLDPGGMPYHLWQLVPKKCLWALVRACGERQSWKERGERFEQLMRYIDDRDQAFPQYAGLDD